MLQWPINYSRAVRINNSSVVCVNGVYCAATIIFIIIKSGCIAAFVAQPSEEIAPCAHKLKERAPSHTARIK